MNNGTNIGLNNIKNPINNAKNRATNKNTNGLISNITKKIPAMTRKTRKMTRKMINAIAAIMITNGVIRISPSNTINGANISRKLRVALNRSVARIEKARIGKLMTNIMTAKTMKATIIMPRTWIDMYTSHPGKNIMANGRVKKFQIHQRGQVKIVIGSINISRAHEVGGKINQLIG